ncbi:hypothetical protein GCM10025881_27430 [Pseudolysinimonas kribbensis]|uniref:Integral membrane protein n=1 Tax=Pseudolysinimonas kribbensis TaxID=433641 RepID=A0ABQ6K958_9MICO|nr:hypothetical protein [Pseudolysinimonas kribbensis]GMA95919.1 hypothetical protein GCM10025881_27430 [Pseudolysinimonas kribbensis]
MARGLGALILAAAATALAISWSDLAPALRAFGVAYLLIVVVVATTAFVADLWAGLGATLLSASQLLVVLEIGGRIDGTTSAFRLAYWVLYLLGLFTIAMRVVRLRAPEVSGRET